jgi:hypothetical protein
LAEPSSPGDVATAMDTKSALATVPAAFGRERPPAGRLVAPDRVVKPPLIDRLYGSPDPALCGVDVRVHELIPVSARQAPR